MCKNILLLPILILFVNPISALFEFHGATKENFRKFQDQIQWKSRSIPFVHNDLTRIIEDTLITSSERYNSVRQILEETIRPIPDEKRTEFLHPDNFSFLYVFPDLKLTHSDYKLLNHRQGYALRRAADYGYTQIVKLLLAYKAMPCFLEAEALRLAAQNGHYEIVKMLYVAGCRIDSKQEFALRSSSALGHSKIVDFLLSVGADPLVKDGFALLCSTDNEIKTKLEENSLGKMSEDARKSWEEESRFGKYGTSYCREFEYCHLQYATGVSKFYFSSLLLTLFLLVLS